MGQGFRGHWNENAVEWSKYRAPVFVAKTCSKQGFSTKCHCFPSQQNQVHSTGAERISHYTALGDAVSSSELQMFSRSFHVKVEKSIIFHTKWHCQVCGLHVPERHGNAAQRHQVCVRPPCAGGWVSNGSRMCQRHQVSEMTCNFVRVPGWVPDVRVIHYLVARMKKNGEQLKESHSQILEFCAQVSWVQMGPG